MKVFHFPAGRRAAEEHIEDTRRSCAAEHLSDDIGRRLAGLEPAGRDQAAGDRRIEMAAGDVPDRERHRQDRQTDRERYRDKPRRRRGEQCSAAYRA